MTDTPRISPKPFNAPPQGLWRATPPAIFPPILGLFGLGLAWRQAGTALGAPAFVGEMVLGAVTLLYLFALLAYLAKTARRAATLTEDLRILPGRAGLSAATASGMLLAAALAPYGTGLARAVLALAILAHLGVALLIIRALLTGPAEQRRVTPVWHLSFVGFIIAPVAATPLGWGGLSQAILIATLPMAAAIWLVSAGQAVRAGVPAPLRPLLAIHLAPVCLFGIVAAGLGLEAVALGFGALGIAAGAVALGAARYLTAAGFSPLWGAFTFPMAAFVNLMFAAALGQRQPFATLGGIALAGVSLAIVWIAWKVMTLWAQGKLVRLTNAAAL